MLSLELRCYWQTLKACVSQDGQPRAQDLRTSLPEYYLVFAAETCLRTAGCSAWLRRMECLSLRLCHCGRPPNRSPGLWHYRVFSRKPSSSGRPSHVSLEVTSSPAMKMKAGRRWSWTGRRVVVDWSWNVNLSFLRQAVFVAQTISPVSIRKLPNGRGWHGGTGTSYRG